MEVSLPRSGLLLWRSHCRGAACRCGLCRGAASRRGPFARTMCMARIHSFVRKTAFQTANRPHRKAAAPRRESAASLADPRHVSVTAVKFSQLGERAKSHSPFRPGKARARRAEALPPPSRRKRPRGRREGVPPLSSQSEGRGRTGAGARVARWPLRPLKEDTVTAPTPTGKGRREGVPPGLDCECNQLDKHAISGLHACSADCIHATKPGAGAVS